MMCFSNFLASLTTMSDQQFYIKTLPTKQAADIALKSRLYVSGWTLSRMLKTVRADDSTGYCILAFNQETDQAVGVCVHLHEENEDEVINGVFVKKQYRNKGIGTMLAITMSEKYIKRKYQIYTGCSPSLVETRYAVRRKLNEHFKNYSFTTEGIEA